MLLRPGSARRRPCRGGCGYFAGDEVGFCSQCCGPIEAAEETETAMETVEEAQQEEEEVREEQRQPTVTFAAANFARRLQDRFGTTAADRGRRDRGPPSLEETCSVCDTDTTECDAPGIPVSSKPFVAYSKGGGFGRVLAAGDASCGGNRARCWQARGPEHLSALATNRHPQREMSGRGFFAVGEDACSHGHLSAQRWLATRGAENLRALTAERLREDGPWRRHQQAH